MVMRWAAEVCGPQGSGWSGTRPSERTQEGGGEAGLRLTLGDRSRQVIHHWIGPPIGDDANVQLGL